MTRVVERLRPSLHPHGNRSTLLPRLLGKGVVSGNARLNTSRGRRCHGSFSRAVLQSEYSTDYSYLSPLHLLHGPSTVS